MSSRLEALSAAESRSVQGEWLRRVEAEYRSAAITQHLTLWLLQVVAPFELTRMGLAVVEDELAHSELSQQVYRAAGGTATASLEAQQLGLRQPPPAELLSAIQRCVVETFCLGETVAVRLFAKLRAPCEQPDARTALDRIIRDEVRHRDFGWTLLEWLLSTDHGGALRQRITAELPQCFSRLQKTYALSELGKAANANEKLASWGLMRAPSYAAALLESYERDYIPLFESMGIDAKRAWEAAP